MKKIVLYGVILFGILGLAAIAQAIPLGVTNLLANGSFEVSTGSGMAVDFDSWSEGGEWYRDGRAYDGLASARLGVETGNLYQPFSITEGDTLYFGAYFSIITNNIGGGNWDVAQINMQVAGLPDSTIGESISNFTGLSWNLVGGTTYMSDWFLVATMVDISGVTLPNSSAMNISMQNYNPANTRLLVDGAYAGTTAAPVPEPATMLLLGGGLIGLASAGFRRKK